MKHIITIGLHIFILSATAFAQKNLRGKVFDAATKSPLAGATITAPGNRITTTDKDGVFTIECGKINYVPYLLLATKPIKKLLRIVMKS